MNGIRFVHTDYLRLAGCINGLAAAPDWLRRLARDATRGAVSRVFEIASTRHVDFILVGGTCCDVPEFDSSVARWLQEPLKHLRQQGTKIVMAADRHSDVDQLADHVIRKHERLLVSKTGSSTRFAVEDQDSKGPAELAVSSSSCGPCSYAGSNYVYHPQTQYAVHINADQSSVYSAGSPQAHGPHEQGEFGCLVVNIESPGDLPNVLFEPTAPLRFETNRIQNLSTTTSDDICEAVVTKSLDLARRQRSTTVVDWHIEDSMVGTGPLASWRQQTILDSVRHTLQQGHLGVWPRRVVVSPSAADVALPDNMEVARELSAVLYENRGESRDERHQAFAQLVTGTQLLCDAA